MKVFLDGNTGTGKTSSLVCISRLYSQLFPKRKIYTNFHLENIKNVIYTPFMFLPISEIIKGKCLLLFDDCYVFKKVLDKYISILSVFSRKLKISTFYTIQYYTMLSKENRSLCHEKWVPKITIIKNSKMTEKSEIIIECQNPITEQILRYMRIKNPLSLIKGFYNTNEIPLIPNERNIINEITKFSKDYSDIEFNVKITSNNKTEIKKRIKRICEMKGIDFKKNYF